MEPYFSEGNFKLKACASFYLREGWLAKGLHQVNRTNGQVFLAEDATNVLGIGSAMVKSLRYWMQASGLAIETKGSHRCQTLTTLGQSIYQNDRYFEDAFSLYLVHYELVKNSGLSTLWHLFFNYFHQKRFSRASMEENLVKVFNELGAKDYSVNSFSDDCVTVLKTYLQEKKKQDNPEVNLQSPLVSLDLLAEVSHGVYEKTMPSYAKLHPYAILYVMSDQIGVRKSISFEDLLTEPNNVGRVFNLNQYRLNEYLDALQSKGHIGITRTGGLNMVYIQHLMTTKTIIDAYHIV